MNLCTGQYGCSLIISDNTTFALPTFPSKYKDPIINCAFFFISPLNKPRVRLTFLYLDIHDADCNTDKIEVFTGLSTFSSTSKICNGDKVVEFASRGFMKMIFTGKSVGKYRGFHALATFF